MNETLKVYELKLKTLGPVFIGDGTVISKKDYIAFRDEALIPDIHKMYNGLRDAGLADQYESYLIDQKQEDLSFWLREKGIQRKDYNKWISYRLSRTDIESVKGDRKREIHTFVKDAYGVPYVPGSSIKGMLRTILLTDEIIRHPETFKNVRKTIENAALIAKKTEKINRKFLSEEADKIESEAFRKLERNIKKRADAVNDIMAAIRVSDSEPLDTDDLALCQKVDMKPDGSIRNLPMVRECIRPGTEIICTITVDVSMLSDYGQDILDKKRIESAINVFSKVYNKTFRCEFSENLPYYPKEEEDMSAYLGGGSGFAVKTVLYPLFGRKDGLNIVHEVFRKTLNQKVYKDHGHGNDIRLGVSPHTYKITYYEGECYEMGKCLLEVNYK